MVKMVIVVHFTTIFFFLKAAPSDLPNGPMKAKLKSGSSSMGTSFECLFPYICRHHHALQFCVSRLITLHLFMSLIQGGFLFSIASLKLGCY